MTALQQHTEAAIAVKGGLDRDVVSVHVLGLGSVTAWCSCGWAGRRRMLRASAMQDAWVHAARDGCEVSSPLLLTR